MILKAMEELVMINERRVVKILAAADLARLALT
jgi:hypothetical protein